MSDRRLVRPANQPLRPQLGQRHVQILQGTRLRQDRRLQGCGEDPAGLRRRRPGGGEGPAGNRLFGHWLSHFRSPRCHWPRSENDKPVEPTFANALNKTYPLGRTLFIYVSKRPGQPLPPPVKEFLKFVLSRQGQEIVVKDGFGQLPDKAITKNVKVLELTQTGRVGQDRAASAGPPDLTSVGHRSPRLACPTLRPCRSRTRDRSVA